MTTATLEAHAARDVPETRIRELALAKVKAEGAYKEALYRNVQGASDDELVARELDLAAARKAMYVAQTAFDRAI